MLTGYHKDGDWEACPFTHPCDDKNNGKRMFDRSVDYFLAVRNLPLLLTATGVDRSVATAHTAIKSSLHIPVVLWGHILWVSHTVHIPLVLWAHILWV